MSIRAINIPTHMLAKAKIFFAVGIDRPCGADSA
jgi:hypothetical protein